MSVPESSQSFVDPLLDQHEKTVRCCDRGWPPFWVGVSSCAVSGVIANLMTPDLATIYFNGGTDPCTGVGQTSPACSLAVQKSSEALATCNLISATLVFISAPVVGILVDMRGVKKLLVLALVLGTLTSFAFSSVVFFDVTIYAPLIMSEIQSLMPTSMLSQAYVAEATPAASRAKVFARLSAVASVDGVVGPLVTLFISRHGAAVIVVLSMLISVFTAQFFLSDPSAKRLSKGQHGESGTRQSVREQFAVIFVMFNHPIYFKLALLIILGGTTSAGLGAIWLYFLKIRFGMDYQDAAPFVSVSTLSTVLVNVFLVNPMMRLMGLKNLAIFSFGKGILTCVGYIFAPSKNWLYLICFCVGLDSVFAPVVLALFTNLADKDQGLGVSVGAINSLTTISAIFGPLLYRVIFISSLAPSAWFPEGFVYSTWLLTIIVSLVCIMLLICIPSSAFPKTMTASVNEV